MTVANRPKWTSPFGRWLMNYGTERLRAEFARRGTPVSRQCLYHWGSGRRRPRVQHAAVLIEVSRGRLRLGDFRRKEDAS